MKRLKLLAPVLLASAMIAACGSTPTALTEKQAAENLHWAASVAQDALAQQPAGRQEIRPLWSDLFNVYAAEERLITGYTLPRGLTAGLLITEPATVRWGNFTGAITARDRNLLRANLVAAVREASTAAATTERPFTP